MNADLFTSDKISKHTTRIVAPCGVCVYLTEGKQEAALLDTAFGIGNLKDYIETLTDKPVEVILSHGHLDHAGGAAQFEKVYLNSKDLELAKRHCDREYRINCVANGPSGMPNGISPDDFLPSRAAPYLPVKEGDIFDLGDVTVKPISVAGHTQGMLVFLIPEDRIAIFGDACGEYTLLNMEESAPISEFRKNLLHLQTFEPLYDTVLRNHGTYISPKDLLENNIELCNAILSGTDDAIPTEFSGRLGCLARKDHIPGKCGNILYDPNRK